MGIEDKLNVDYDTLLAEGAQFFPLSSYRQYATLDTGNGIQLYVEQRLGGTYRIVADGTLKPDNPHQGQLPYNPHSGHDTGDEHK